MGVNNMTDSVVHLHEVEPGIVQITMEDRENKNTFTEALSFGLMKAFKHIDETPEYKVVILTGFDTFFCSGGTQEGLLALSNGEGKFTDFALYSLPLDCKVPVISAMQGHGIGGGFILGMFADFVLLSRESVYTTNFMKYGFTPGFGSTFILREKLGLPLSQEMLMKAANYRGAELQERGIAFPVYPRSEVLEEAYKLARQLAEKPRVSLITLKDHLVADIREKLPEVVEKEVAMHDKTFHQPEVKERIQSLFGR